MNSPRIYQAIVVKQALKMWIEHGMKVNRDYTPKRMVLTATTITGKSFKPRDYKGAFAALEAWLEEITKDGQDRNDRRV